MEVAIIYDGFLDQTGTKLQIGGVETYLWHLSRICLDLGWGVTVYQGSAVPFRTRVDNVSVVGVGPLSRHPPLQARQLCAYASKRIPKDGLLIFGSDHCCVRTNHPRTLAIQHGIAWDLPAKYLTRQDLLRRGLGAALWKCYLRLRAKTNFEHCQNRVCVDYNFLNWYHTHNVSAKSQKAKVWVIPNFAIPLERSVLPRPRTKQKIIFARRFVEYRGTHLVASTVHALLEKYPFVDFTLAGEGPDEAWLREQFSNESRVEFINYHPRDAVLIHSSHDIAVVPSLGSEGTAFAVAEAMAAGCAVVASRVGGVTNMIISGYNGILIHPDSDSLTLAVSRLIDDSAMREALAAAGQRTALAAFSYDAWCASWRDVLQQVAADRNSPQSDEVSLTPCEFRS
jgi:glycosyltransferase involved in cell wall biosynthesis